MRKSKFLLLFLTFMLVFTMLFSACTILETPGNESVEEEGKNDSIISYQVTFDSNGGSEVESVAIQPGLKLQKPENPIKKGYYFKGWYLDQNFNNKFSFDEVIDKDFTLYAKWVLDEVTITIDTMGGNEMQPVILSYNEMMTFPNLPIKRGYKFAGWFFEKEYINQYKFEFIPEQDETIYAKWIKNNADEYTVTLMGNGGQGTYITSYKNKDGTYLPDDWERKGYTFLGWYDNKDFKGKPITYVAPNTNDDVVFYAKWEAVYCDVTLYDGDNKYSTFVIHPEDNKVLPILPDKLGYTFDGWCKAPEGECERLTSITMEGNRRINLYARWKAKECELFFYLNDGTETYSIKRDFGTTISLSSPTNEKYSFEGWYTNQELSGQRLHRNFTIKELEMHIYAKWIPKIFEVSFYGNGGVNQNQEENFTLTYSYGDNLVLPTNMTRPGYTFLGWLDNTGGRVSYVTEVEAGDFGNKTYIAQWEEETYSIVLDKQGGNYVSGNIVTSYVHGTNTYLPLYDKEGYKFLGWSESQDGSTRIFDHLTPEDYGDKHLYAIYEVKEFIVSIYVTEKTIKRHSIPYGTPINFENPTREGYDFVGFYSDAALTQEYVMGSLMPANNIEIYTKWQAKDYTIKFISEGAQYGEILTVACGADISTLRPTDPKTSTFKKFIGWFENETPIKGEVEFQFTVMPAKDLVLYARTESIIVNNKTYAIDYYEIDDTPITGLTPNQYEANIGVVLPVPEKTGYSFGGWYIAKDFLGAKIEKIGANETGKKVFYAKWIPNTYDITYVLTNEKDTIKEQYTYGLVTLLKDNPTRNGYKFLGWYDNAAYEGAIFTQIEADSMGNKKFYAKWEVATYTVTLIGNGGSGEVNTLTYKYGEGCELPENWTKKGYNFLKWSEEIEGGSAINAISTTDFGDKTLYAQWIAIPYHITLQGNGGNGSNVGTYTYQSEKELPTDWTKKGYDFAGWYLDEALSQGPYTKVPKEAIGDITLYAKWENAVYSITLISTGGGSGDNITSYTYGSDTILPSNWQKDGYVFGGWYTDHNFDEKFKITKIDKTMTGDLVLYAKWIANDYTIKFVTNLGSSIESITLKCGETIVMPEDPTKTKAIFAGWFEDKEFTIPFNEKVMPARDLTLYAKWEDGAKLTCYSFGEVVLKQNYDPNQTATLITDVNKCSWNQPDYIFEGWYYDEEFTMPCNITSVVMDQHINLYAKWTQRGFMAYLEKFRPAITASNIIIEVDSQRELIALMDFIMFNAITHNVGIRCTYLPNKTQEAYKNEILEEVFSGKMTAPTYSISYSYDANRAVMYIAVSLSAYGTSIEVETPNPQSMIEDKVVNGLVPVHEPLRVYDYNDFKINSVTKEMGVTTSNQLFYAVQYGFKPICSSQSPADRYYKQAKDILRGICDDNMTDFEKVYAIFTWFVQNVDYDYKAVEEAKPGHSLNGLHNNAEAWAMEGVFNKQLAVCDGMSKAFTLLCRIEGIPAIRVTSVDHAWNKVFIDLDGNGVREWYGVDVTWGSRNIGGMGCTDDVEHLLFTDEFKTQAGAIEKNHLDIVADTEVDPYKYATYENGGVVYDSVIESYVELTNIIDEAIENRNTYATKPLRVSISIRLKYSNKNGVVTSKSVMEELNSISIMLRINNPTFDSFVNTSPGDGTASDETIIYIKFK